MDINKAIRKQKKSYKIFMLSMCFIFLTLPIILFLYGNITTFLLSYLIVIELMIVLAIVKRINWEKLCFRCRNNKLKIKVGTFISPYILFCDKVVLVHTEKSEEYMEIILVTNAKVRNKKLRYINLDFYKKYPVVAMKYNKIKRMCPENRYYYFVIRKGGFYKYKLLDVIYKNCVKAIYTEEAIENIKFARGQKEF